MSAHTPPFVNRQSQDGRHEDLPALFADLAEKTKLLETTLASMSQGIFMIGVDGRVSTFNTRVCELLDLPESLLNSRPTLQEVTVFQLQRGDFGPNASLVDQSARAYVVAQGCGDLPMSYLRRTITGRVLEVKTQVLPGGGMVRTFSDVTSYTEAQEALARLNMLLDASQSLAQVGGWEVDLVNNKVYWTNEIYRMLETSPQEYTPTIETTLKFYAPESVQRIQEAIQQAVQSATPHDMEVVMITAKGRRIWVHSKSTVTQVNGQVIKRTAVLQDITRRKQAENELRETEALWKLALDSTGDGVWDWHVKEGVEFFSKRYADMYGYEESELKELAGEFDTLTHPDDQKQMLKDRQAHFDGLTPTYRNEHRIKCKDGSWKWVLSRGMVISRDDQNQPLRMVGTHTDITSSKHAEAMILQQANFDMLTGLPNRRMLRDRLEQHLRKSRRDGLPLAVLFIDLDHFKEVNDTLGHDRGDMLLVEAAHRLRQCVRDSDTVARMGGDEFTIVLTELTDSVSIERVCDGILKSMSSPFQLVDEQVFISASIGITMSPEDASEVEPLFKNADQALYVAKGAGRNRFSFFTPELQLAAQNRARLANDLRVGLVNQQFFMVYQPIVDLKTGAVHKAEALIRWQHPTRGLISPTDFIPIAEASGLIVDIGDWVFRTVAAQTREWRTTLWPDFQVSVNKSPAQFHHDGGSNQPCLDFLTHLSLPGEAIAVEITEGLLLDASERVTLQLLSLHDAGVQVSLDDFGTGYSSLSYLQRFDIDTIKIDQSFVRHLIPDSTDLALCKAIIVMAHELGMKVVAEGIETEQQRHLLVAAGCDYGQGYWLARPMTAQALEVFLSTQPASTTLPTATGL